MKAERWKQIKTIYQQAAESPPERRQEILNRVCGDDAELLREVQSMLKFQTTAEGFIEEPVFDVGLKFLAEDAAAAILPTGESIDNYRIVREIGRGGMGAVFLAERSDGLFDQRVALKIIKRGMDTDAILRRFVMERQILAGLDHANIARLLDGGTTRDGLPYFVMEYVEGLPVDKYCDGKKLSLTERLRLFQKICEAVAYAHQHLIVHRDLKPSNILVTKDGEPKLLDFGIAKLLHSEPTGETQATETASRFLTPEYASPEQVSGERITTQSDVFSLGVLLNKLIFGDTKLGATTEKTGASKTFDKDLRVILETARHPDQARRYSSVEMFSDDIRRLLDGLPLLAQRDSFVYRASKFIRRNAAAVSLSALAVFALAFAAVFSIWQAQRASAAQKRAEKRFNDVRKMANNVLFEYHDRIEELPNSTQVREKMLKDSLEYLDSLSQEAADDRELLRELGAAYEKVGTIQGNTRTGNLNDTQAMAESYRKSFEIRRRLAALEPNNDEIRREFAISLENLGDIEQQTGNLRGALERYVQARDIVAEMAARDAKHLTYLARLYSQIGLVQGFPGESNLGETQAAIENTARAAEIMRGLYESDPANFKYIRGYIIYKRNLGNMLMHAGDLKGAFQQVSEVLPLAEKWVAAEPENITAQETLGITYSKMSDVLAHLNEIDRAIEYQKKAVALDEPAYLSDPKNRRAREVCIWYYKLGKLYGKKRDFAAAEREHLKALKIFQQNYDEDPTSVNNQIGLADSHFAVAEMYEEAGKLDRAQEFYEKCLKSYEDAAVKDAANLRVKVNAAESRVGLGDVYFKKKDLRAALNNYQAALPVLREQAALDSANAKLQKALRELEVKISALRKPD